jgi:hypothetical protein
MYVLTGAQGLFNHPVCTPSVFPFPPVLSDRWLLGDHIQYNTAFRNLFSPAAHRNLSKTHGGTPQNFASPKGGTKLYMTINMYLHINPCPIRMQAYKSKT